MDILNVACAEISELEKSKKLGQGSQGAVYMYCAIIQNQTKCDYAVKVQYKCDIKTMIEEYEINQRAYNLRLAYNIYQIKECMEVSHIDKIKSSTNKSSTCLMLMDLAKGDTLYTLLAKKRGELPTGVSTCVLINKVFETINFLHKNKIIHGDLNPSNIFVEFVPKFDESNSFDIRVKFIDFTVRPINYGYSDDFGALFYYFYNYTFFPGEKSRDESFKHTLFGQVMRQLVQFNDDFSKIARLIYNDKQQKLENKLWYLYKLAYLWVFYNIRKTSDYIEDFNNPDMNDLYEYLINMDLEK